MDRILLFVMKILKTIKEHDINIKNVFLSFVIPVIKLYSYHINLSLYIMDIDKLKKS